MNELDFLADEALLPAQYYPKPAQTPIQRLALAVLESAIGDLTRGCGPELSTRAKAEYLEAYKWLFCATAGPFSFVDVCALLEIEPEYLRKGLRRFRGRLPRHSGVIGGRARPMAKRVRAR